MHAFLMLFSFFAHWFISPLGISSCAAFRFAWLTCFFSGCVVLPCLTIARADNQHWKRTYGLRWCCGWFQFLFLYTFCFWFKINISPYLLIFLVIYDPFLPHFHFRWIVGCFIAPWHWGTLIKIFRTGYWNKKYACINLLRKF